MDSTNHRFFAPCPRGLEGVLDGELKSLGVSETTKTDGGVGFTASWTTMCWVNLNTHIASRVLWEVGQRAYKTEQDVYHAAYALAWPDWFTPAQTIKVKVSARRCRLPSLDFLTLRIKDAICDRFTTSKLRRPNVDTNRPDIRLDAFLDDRTVTFYVDTSGEPLFKRGHRMGSVEAPLRENLAAGILRLAGWTANDILLDPMCGSGTIPLEAALMARRIAPGISRSFGFERLLIHDTPQWNQLRERERSNEVAHTPAPIYASDRDPETVKVAQRTFQDAGVANDIRLTHSNMFDLNAPAKQGVLIINPPYGVRLSRPEELASFYPQLGDWLKQRFAGWRAYVLTGDARLVKLIGLTPSKRIPLYNGALECRLYEFLIVEGGARRRLKPKSQD